jgi:hypothetical protein
MINKTKLALVAALVLGTSSFALALPGLDGDNNPIPGASTYYASQPQAFGHRSER